MIVKRIPGVIGFNLTYDRFDRSAYLTLLFVTWKFHWPRVGRCLHCGHGPRLHAADRSRGLIIWRCRAPSFENKAPCPCDHYSPERAA